MDLKGCREKIKRAREQIQGVAADIMAPDAVGADAIITIKAVFDPPSGKYICIVDHIPSTWQTRVSVVAGEVVHDLRSALDHLAWQLVLDHSGSLSNKNAKKVQFPILKKQKDWSNNYTVSMIKSANASLLVPRQPFSSQSAIDSHPLAVLQYFSNQDKHRILNSVLVRPLGFSLNDSDTVESIQVSYDFGSASPVLTVGSELVRIGGLPPNLEDQVSQASSVFPLVLLPHHTDVSFTKLDEDTVQQSLIARLNTLSDYVEQTIDLFP